MSQQPASFALGGGLDLVTPAMARKAGSAIRGRNYEPCAEGYRRCAGYERYDGRGLPSEASYWVLPYSAAPAAIAAGTQIVGEASTATATVLRATTDNAGVLILGDVNGVFREAETITSGGQSVATVHGPAVERGFDVDADDKAAERLAIEHRRALVVPVPGSGPIRGVWVYAGTVYAFRDDEAGAYCVMHAAVPGGGWSPVDLGAQMAYSGGTAEIAEGVTVHGVTSGATAVVRRVVVASGDWTTGDAAGRLIVGASTGIFQSGEDIAVDATNKAKAAGPVTPIRLLPGGRFRFQNYNFWGTAGSQRMYGCDGKNQAFEFDGSVFVPILTGMAADTPTLLAIHLNYLFLAFPGGSVQLSALGNPYNWTVVLGAGEIGLGDEVTGMLPEFKGVLVIFCRNKTAILYGSAFSGADADAELKTLSLEAGAYENSVQLLTNPVCLDVRGVRDLGATDTYGNFRTGTLSLPIDPWMVRQRKARVAASMIVRAKDQYRLWWDDGQGLVMDLSAGRPCFMPIDFGGKPVRCCCSVEGADGEEWLLFGSDDGFVYRMDSGTSWDGQPVEAYLRLAFNALGSPAIIKRFHKVTAEVQAQPLASLLVTADFSYGALELPSFSGEQLVVHSSGGFWSEDFWQEFYWSQVEGEAEAYIDGEGSNISIAIASNSATEDPHTIHGMTVHYSARRLRR